MYGFLVDGDPVTFVDELQRFKAIIRGSIDKQIKCIRVDRIGEGLKVGRVSVSLVGDGPDDNLGNILVRTYRPFHWHPPQDEETKTRLVSNAHDQDASAIKADAGALFSTNCNKLGLRGLKLNVAFRQASENPRLIRINHGTVVDRGGSYRRNLSLRLAYLASG